MKITKTLVFLSLCSFLMSGCQSQITGIYVENNIDMKFSENASIFQNISVSNLESRINNKETFPLFYYSQSCSMCDEAQQTLISYLSKIDKPFSIYRLITDINIQEELIDRYPSYFANLSAPELILFDEGKPIHTITYNVLSNYNQFYQRNHKRFKRQNVDTLTHYESFVSYMNDAQNTLIYFYDSSDSQTLSFYQNAIKNRAKTSQKNILKIDKYLVNEQDFADFLSFFSIDDSSNGSYIIHYQNKNTFTVCSYLNDKEKAEIILDDFFRK